MTVFLLDRWSFSPGWGYGFASPESFAISAYGLVTGNPKFRDCQDITTSQLRYFEPEKMLIKTLNSTYQLLTIHPNFQEYLDKNGFILEQYQANLI